MNRIFIFVLLTLSVTARADTLEQLLARGPLVLVENDAKGKFASATGIISINAPLEKVWGIVTDYSKYKEFIPKVVSTKFVEGEGTNDPQVRWEIDTPGLFNTVYVVHYHIDAASHFIAAEWVKGDLKDSHWDYKFESAGPNTTLIYYKSVAKHFSSILESIEDSQQTMTVAVNVGGALGLLRGVKKRAEAQ